MVNARSTAKHRELLEQINADRFADGGLIGALTNPIRWLAGKFSGPLGKLRDIAGSGFGQAISAIPRKIASLLVEKVKGLFTAGGGPLGGGAVMGWQNQINVLRRAFPGLALISGYRPGSIVRGTNSLSYHALGRAVDVPPRMDVFNWIRAAYGARTKELIFSPAGGRQIWNGRDYTFTGITRDDHWNHVHWAMDRGGYLQPGWNPPAFNGTGQRERILDAAETRAYERGGISPADIRVAFEGMEVRFRDPLGRVVAGQLATAGGRGRAR
jgi:hypothetical protein